MLLETLGVGGNMSNLIKKILSKKDFELNSLNYESALKLDHRNYCQYYFSLLKNDHPIIFSFGSYNDYNLKTIKIILFFFSFCSDFTINALFFTDDTMHKIYEDQDILVDLKQEKNNKNLNNKYLKLLRIIKTKFILFYIFSFIILVLFWYYITCFCGIYINTQTHLIKDSLISLVTSLLYPFIIDIIPGIFRIAALRVGKPTRSCLYKFSQIIS